MKSPKLRQSTVAKMYIWRMERGVLHVMVRRTAQSKSEPGPYKTATYFCIFFASAVTISQA